MWIKEKKPVWVISSEDVTLKVGLTYRSFRLDQIANHVYEVIMRWNRNMRWRHYKLLNVLNLPVWRHIVVVFTIWEVIIIVSPMRRLIVISTVWKFNCLFLLVCRLICANLPMLKLLWYYLLWEYVFHKIFWIRGFCWYFHMLYMRFPEREIWLIIACWTWDARALVFIYHIIDYGDLKNMGVLFFLKKEQFIKSFAHELGDK